MWTVKEMEVLRHNVKEFLEVQFLCFFIMHNKIRPCCFRNTT